jgi:fructosamine-3-kinase
MQRALADALHAALGSAVKRASPAAGGDINQGYRVELAGGRELFVKTHGKPLAQMYSCEARGLAWLAQSEALRTPRVLALSDAEPAFLALELIRTGRKAPDHDEQLGRGLAALHRAGAPSFGLAHDNYIAVLPQDNRQSDSWASFYVEHRLEPQLARAVDAGGADTALRAAFFRLFSRIRSDPEPLCGPPEPPARLHGDLWAGNALTDERGAPCLIDPAVYGGHREIDLAMMRLFGGFAERCFAAYHEAFPLAQGHQQRVGFYQLYPLLVHVNLFGGGYAGSVQRTLDRLV